MTTLTNGFANYTDAKLEMKTQVVITKMTENPNFPAPSPTIAAIEGALAAFIAAAVAAKTGDTVALLERDEKKLVLVKLLHELSLYVMFIAKGEKSILASSGFDLSKDREPTSPIEKPEGVEVRTDGQNAGSALVKVQPVKNAKGYVFEFTADEVPAESSWLSKNATRSKLLISGLEGGKRYHFRVTALGTRNQAMTSSVVSKMID